MLIGGHVSASGGLYKSFLRGKEIDADCIQIFVSSPRTWSVNPISKESIDQYKSESEKFTLSPVLVHGKYLISLGMKKILYILVIFTIALAQDDRSTVFSTGNPPELGVGWDIRCTEYSISSKTQPLASLNRLTLVYVFSLSFSC